MKAFFGVNSLSLLARLLVTAPFWISGLSKSLNFELAVSEITRAGLEPAVWFSMATIALQLSASAMIISRRHVWVGTLALIVFTALTIPIVHHFWAISEEPFRTISLHTATEHIGLIGGLIAAAALSSGPRSPTRKESNPEVHRNNSKEHAEAIFIPGGDAYAEGRQDTQFNGHYIWY